MPQKVLRFYVVYKTFCGTVKKSENQIFYFNATLANARGGKGCECFLIRGEVKFSQACKSVLNVLQMVKGLETIDWEPLVLI